tara:strand:+ start:279 stop:671 length:393 start_codon:yes stop_codon:yes gene_type:complete
MAYQQSAKYGRQQNAALAWADLSKDNDMQESVRLAQAQAEQAYIGAGREIGVRIWRVEAFELNAWPEESYGEFYRGDSYIILHTYGHGSALFHDIYFWIGSESTQDEYGTAAIKAVRYMDHSSFYCYIPF